MFARFVGYFERKYWIFVFGILFGIIFIMSLYQTSVYFSTDESCMMCHVHPHAEESWRQSIHVNNSSGVKVGCVSCHLPPQNQTRAYYTAKVKLGIRDVWGFLTKDSADFNWEEKSLLENAIKYIPNSSCVECHQNLFPKGISTDGLTAHLYYENNATKLNLQCISCHLDAGHANPNYKHGKMSEFPGIEKMDKTESNHYFDVPTQVTTFNDFVENIPGTAVEISMKAIPGGTFKMGSPMNEPFRKEDEGPVRNVTISPFFMSETEITWDQYWAFFENTISEGRIPPSDVFANNSNPDVDAISGPTPPYGSVDQGWGGGSRSAITMTHYAAEIFCLWLSKKTGKKYRLPTEAEWEYAARGGTETPYFFNGNPKKFSEKGFLRRLVDASTDNISDYVIYSGNSNNRTQEPDKVKPNPFGLKNMLGNVMEYCADKYSAIAYSETSNSVKDPVETEGEEYVIRGGNYASDAAEVRCAARSYTNHDTWLRTDPQQPKSLWWYSDFRGIGFRVVCDSIYY